MKKIEKSTGSQPSKEVLKEYAYWLKGRKFLEKAIFHYVSHMFGIQEYYQKETGMDFFSIRNVKKLKDVIDHLPVEYRSGKYVLALKYYLQFIEERYK